MEKPWLGNWPKGVPQSIQYPEICLGEVLRNSAKESPDRVAVIYFGTQLTFRQLDTLVDRFGQALENLGVKKGDRVGIYLPNVPQFVIAYYGALRIGAICVALSPIYKETEISLILADSGAKVLVAWDKLYPYVQAVKNKTELTDVITTSVRDYLPPILKQLSPLKGVKSYACPGAKDMKTLLAKYHGQPRPIEINPKKDVALLQYTGGTTGIPKGAMLTHYNLVVNAVQAKEWAQLGPEEVHLAALPFFHIFGMTNAMNTPIYTKTTMILVPDARDIPAILATIEKYKPSVFCGVPTLYNALINRPDIQEHNLRSVRLCISGASALPLEVQRKFEALTGGRLVEGYGLTETSPSTHCNPLDDPAKNRIGTIGIPFPDTEAKVVDMETGTRDLAIGEVGELVIRGPQVMMGYWNKPDENKIALREGWFYTGDIATMDPDGYFRIVDRKKDMIDVSGYKVWPREVEERLYEHPAVKEAAVVPMPDPRSGEAVTAFVVLKEGYQDKVGAEDIASFCKEKMAAYKAPKVVEFQRDLPKTAAGKVLRRALKEQARTMAQQNQGEKHI